MFERLELSKSTLRPWRRDDLDALIRHADDPRVSATVRDTFPSPYTRTDGNEWLIYATAAGRPFNRAIEVDGEACGGIGVIPGEDVHRIRAEIGYWLGRDRWGRGIMSEVVAAFADALLGEGEGRFLRLEAPVFASNPASARVLEKAGFERESTQRRAALKRGELLDVWLYVRLA